jgi:phosphoenolpyruvate carboxykinase (GTP)
LINLRGGKVSDSLSELLTRENHEKLIALNNKNVEKQLLEFINLCKPTKITVLDESREDIEYTRMLALRNGEETNLAMRGHTIHFDGPNDLARDRGSTKVLTPPGMRLGKNINTIERKTGLAEIMKIMDGAMRGKEMLVKFYSQGPTDSEFTICALQITDSAYVAHSEDLLYRQGYNQFKKLKKDEAFFTFLHSAGELTDTNVTKNVELRRIYIDVIDGKVYSVNNQYAGNSVGLKKLALRLAIYKANHEDWLSEHMLVMGIHPPDMKRVTYFTGAYPSACGKTSTAMIPGQSIVGDDIAYLKEDDEGFCRAVNIEQGIFGIIQDVNPEDDPVIYNALTTPRELIFSNVLVSDGVPFWLGMGREPPSDGVNYQGDWHEGLKDPQGNDVPYAHPNARYTMRLNELDNVDPKYNDPEGVQVHGIFYGGRDSDTNVPISEALSWEHGVYIGATLESETTTATIGKTGVRKQDPMANIDFVVVPLSLYISNHMKFGKKLKHKPRVYSTNYFLKHDGKYTNTKLDKKIWVIWAEGRTHGDYSAIRTPIGYIPYYEDLEKLFKEVFDREYTRKEYEQQFSIRLDKYLEKHVRMDTLYSSEPNMPKEFWDEHRRVKEELEKAKTDSGRSVLLPRYFSSKQ